MNNNLLIFSNKSEISQLYKLSYYNTINSNSNNFEVINPSDVDNFNPWFSKILFNKIYTEYKEKKQINNFVKNINKFLLLFF